MRPGNGHVTPDIRGCWFHVASWAGWVQERNTSERKFKNAAGHTEVVRMLLQAGADVAAANLGVTALHLAAENGP